MTETDKAVEVMVAGRLRGAYPEFAFIGEETWRPGMELTDGKFVLRGGIFVG